MSVSAPPFRWKGTESRTQRLPFHCSISGWVRAPTTSPAAHSPFRPSLAMAVSTELPAVGASFTVAQASTDPLAVNVDGRRASSTAEPATHGRPSR